MATAKLKAQRIQAGRYTYRTYLIEEVSHDAGTIRPLWLISTVGNSKETHDAAESLANAKAMIDHWFANNTHPTK